MIDFKCPKCFEVMSVPDSLAGGTESCPACGNITYVPSGTNPATTRHTRKPSKQPKVPEHELLAACSDDLFSQVLFVYMEDESDRKMKAIFNHYRRREYPDSPEFQMFFFNDREKAARKLPIDDALSCLSGMYLLHRTKKTIVGGPL